MRFPVFLFLTLLTAAFLPLAATAGSGDDTRHGTAPPDFNRDVRPVLSQNCFKCHGPDDGQRMAGLRLDLRAGALATLASGGKAIVPGKTRSSELVARITTTGPGQMPPPGSNKTLTPAQKEILKRWVTSGAKYDPHWAFVVPQQAPLPRLRDAASAKGVRNSIDAFVRARLEKEGLRPTPEADRYTLVRRVYLDLIGIPPTPEEADAFLRDARPDAYERVVDKLLASPHYGERWARRWLDLARYSDTNGYEKDRPRSIWPYRDWVIHSLNADMPFSEFTVEQLAGDLLPSATLDQRIATGFHRNTMRNEEGGIDPLEYRFLSLVDRVSTTGTTWLGMTVGCAQCHTHKYDPITQKDYYRLFALLNNCDEPTIDLPTPRLAATHRAAEAEVRAREALLADHFPGANGLSGAENLQARFAAWKEAAAEKAIHWSILTPTKLSANIPTLVAQSDGSILASGDQSKRDDYEVTFAPGQKGITAIRLEVLPDDSLPKRGPGRVDYEGPFGDFFLSEFTAQAEGKPAPFASASQSFPASGNTAQKAIDGDPSSGWSVNGAQGTANEAVFRFAAPVEAQTLAVRLHFERYYAAGLGHFRISVTRDARPAEAGPPPDVEAILTVAEGERTSVQQSRLRAYFLSIAPEMAKEREVIAKIRAPDYPTTLVLQERPAGHRRPTFVHHRGEYLQPTDPVSPGIPTILGSLPRNAPSDRLAFARWLVSPQNPLTARVTVNRQWAAFFGRGIVSTTEDFGYQGQPPTHPELLDWLAVEFEKQNWSLKKLNKLIVMSATYRQSSALTPVLSQHDPTNVLLARGPRFRLEAELVRDSALSEAGLLSPKIGGPSVFPPQPAGVTTEGAYGPLPWNVSAGEDRYRRGLYTFSKRTAPYAMFVAFDAGSGDACLARRDVSNTPLQALTLLNDAVYLEAAQALARAAINRPGTTEERAAYLFRRCATRPPTHDELTLLCDFEKGQKKRFDAKELDASLIAGAGSGDVNERAAWTTLARSLLNLDEVITKE